MSKQAQSLKPLQLQVGKYYLDRHDMVRGPVYKLEDNTFGYEFYIYDYDGYDTFTADGTFDKNGPGAPLDLIQECTQDGTPVPALPCVIRLDDKSIKENGYPEWFLVLTVHNNKDEPFSGSLNGAWDLCLLNNGLSVKDSLEGHPAIGTGFTNHLDYTDYTLYGMSFTSEQEALNARESLKDGTRYKELVQEFIGSKENRIHNVQDDTVDSLAYLSSALATSLDQHSEYQHKQMKIAQSQAAKMQNHIAEFEKLLIVTKREAQYHKNCERAANQRLETLKQELSALRQVQTIRKKACKGLL